MTAARTTCIPPPTSSRSGRARRFGMSASSNEIVIDFDDPTGKQVTRCVREAGKVGAALRQLQGEFPGLTLLVDITAPSRQRLSLVLAGEEGMGILWGDPPLRTLGDESRVDEIPVWDGAGVEMAGSQF